MCEYFAGCKRLPHSCELDTSKFEEFGFSSGVRQSGMSSGTGGFWEDIRGRAFSIVNRYMNKYHCVMCIQCEILYACLMQLLAA